MSLPSDRAGALRLGARLLRRVSMELQSRGAFVDASRHYEAACELDGLRFALDPRMKELEQTGGDARHGMTGPLDYNNPEQEERHAGHVDEG